jgi:Rrf2 family protein
MLTQTSESALKALIYLVHYGGTEPVPPREIAEQIGASPSYMAKITRMLVKTNILRSHRGSLGGVSLSRSPESISLLDIVEACQGLLVGNYCEGMTDHPAPTCAFHTAMVEVHEATISILSKWTLAKLAERPAPNDGRTPNQFCKINIPLPSVNGAMMGAKVR